MGGFARQLGGRSTSPLAAAVTAGRGGFSVASLFAAGEQGGIYDISDLSTLFSDAAGTTPAVVDGVVGTVLDKRFGLARGAEMLPDVQFDTPSQWTLTPPSAGSISVSGGVLSFNTTDGTYTGALPSAAVTIIAGKAYEFVIDCTAISGNGFSVQIGGAQVSFTTTGVKRGILIATGASKPEIKRNTGACSATITSFSVRELPGNHASQATTASKPILRSSGGLYWLEYDGVDDFLVTGNIDFTATDKMTVLAGVHKASDAARAMLLELGNTVAGAIRLEAPNTPANTDFLFASGGSIAGAAFPTATGRSAPYTAVLSGAADIGADSCVLRVNGSAFNNSNDQGTGNYSNNPLYIGRRGGTALPFNGRLYGLIVRGAASTAAQITSAERFLANKTGVTLP